MSLLTSLKLGELSGAKIAKALLPFLAGILVSSAFFCGKGYLSNKEIVRTDTLIIDTSKIIYKTPIYVNNITAPVVDYYHDCWNTLPPFTNEHGDVFSIDSVNSCKGIYKGLHFTYKPDTVQFTKTIFRTDTIEKKTPFVLPERTDYFGYSVKGSFGTGIGSPFDLGLNAEIHFGKVGIFVAPHLIYIDKFRGLLLGGVNYQIL